MTERESYYWWMLEVPGGPEQLRASDIPNWQKLFRKLDSVIFVSHNEDDDNRIEDALDLRRRWYVETNNIDPWREYSFDETKWGEPTVLEIMTSLAIRMEESIMSDDAYGDRTGQWFWNMIVSLGLGGLTDHFYDEAYVDKILSRWMNREYEPNGRGSLFTVFGANNMRDLTIWQEMCAYLNAQY